MKRFFCVFLLLLIPSLCLAEILTCSQDGSGADLSAANFNDSGYWGGGAGEIDPGDTVELLDDGGTFTTRLITQLAGGAATRITITSGSGESVTLEGMRIAHDYITLDGTSGGGTLTFTDTSSEDTTGTIGVDNADYVYIQNVTVQDSQRQGIKFQNSPTNGKIENNVLRRCWQALINLDGTSNQILNNNISDPRSTVGSHSGGGADGMYLYGTGHTVSENYIHDFRRDVGNNTTAHMDGIQTNGATALQDSTIEHNFFFLGNTSTGVLTEANSAANTTYAFMLEGASGNNCSGLVIRNNIIQAWGGMNTGGAGYIDNLHFYNNTFVSDIDFTNTYWGAGIHLDGGSSHEIKNNIFAEFDSASRGANMINLSGGASVDGDYNLFWNSDDSTAPLSGYTPGVNDKRSVNPSPIYDPLFTTEFTELDLQVGSPAIDAGVDLGVANDDALNPDSVWPDNVGTKDQDDYGTGWEIGAYIFPYYYVTQNGSGAADGSSYANSMSVATHNADSFSSSDAIYLCDTITSQVVPPSSGSSGQPITYRGDYTDHAGILDGVSAAGTGAFYLSSKNYITMAALEVTDASDNGVRVVSSSNFTITESCDVNANGGNGIYISGANSTSWVVEDSSITTSWRSGILVDDSLPGAGIIRRNTMDANGQSTDTDFCRPNIAGYSFYHAIYLGSKMAHVGATEIYENILTGTLCGQGIKAKASAMIYRNWIYDNEDFGIMLIGHEDKDGETVNFYVYNNVIYDQKSTDYTASIFYFKENGDDTETINIYLYNNSLYNDSHPIYMAGGQPDVFVMKNNAIHQPADWFAMRFNTIPSGSSTIDYNWSYAPPAFPNLYKWNGSNYTYAGWRGLSFDTSLVNDGTVPGFNNPGSGEFWLQLDSPCIDTGTDLGDSYDDALDPNSSWPDSVITKDQDLFGSGWEIGAYVFEAITVEMIQGTFQGMVP